MENVPVKGLTASLRWHTVRPSRMIGRGGAFRKQRIKNRDVIKSLTPRDGQVALLKSALWLEEFLLGVPHLFLFLHADYLSK